MAKIFEHVDVCNFLLFIEKAHSHTKTSDKRKETISLKSPKWSISFHEPTEKLNLSPYRAMPAI